MISTRASNSVEQKCTLWKRVRNAELNVYDPKSNPKGVVNFGIAENKIGENLLLPKLNKAFIETLDSSSLYYYESDGKQSFRKALSQFFEDNFKLESKVDPDKIVVTNGVSGALNLLGYAVADSGDCFLLPTPVYGCLVHTMKSICNINCYPVPYYEFGDPPSLNVENLETSYHRAVKEGRRVKGLLLTNPNNPTGYTLSIQEMNKISKFCERYDIHLIVDEIFALCCYGEKKFTSFLKTINDTNSHRIHVVWGFSKDIGIAGFRCGMLYTHNDSILHFCRANAKLWSVSSPVQDSITKLISDRVGLMEAIVTISPLVMASSKPTANTSETSTTLSERESNICLFVRAYVHPTAKVICGREKLGENEKPDWCQNTYFIQMSDELKLRHKIVCEKLRKYNIDVWPSSYGIFVMANFSRYLSDQSFQAEDELFMKMLDNKVLCHPGKEFLSTQPGWMRIVFTNYKSHFNTGIQRIEEVLEDILSYCPPL